MQSYVLMVQTDEDDQYFTRSTLAEIGAEIPVAFINSLEEIEEKVANSGEPSVILLNDRGAVHKGNETLKKLKSHKDYAHIPVVMLGEVTTGDYIRECYRAGVNTYIIKPSTVAATRKKIETFFNYWFNVASLNTESKS
jgi:response regulator RpfG family c-di-GMP phosphodiesterase